MKALGAPADAEPEPRAPSVEVSGCRVQAMLETRPRAPPSPSVPARLAWAARPCGMDGTSTMSPFGPAEV